jgi:hypothetical protein
VQSAPLNEDLRQAFRMADHQIVAGVDVDHRLDAAERLDALLL